MGVMLFGPMLAFAIALLILVIVLAVSTMDNNDGSTNKTIGFAIGFLTAATLIGIAATGLALNA